MSTVSRIGRFACFFLLLFALGCLPALAQTDVDLTLTGLPDAAELRADGQATALITFTLTNTDGSTDATGVTVDVDVPSALTLQSSTPSAGTYGSGTWDVGTVSAFGSETLELSVSLSSTTVPQDVWARLGTFDQNDPNGAAARGRVVPTPYGSGTALRFSGARVTVPNNPAINTDGPYATRTIELWFNANDLSPLQFLYDEGGQNNGFNVYLEGGQLYVGSWGTGVNDRWFSTTTVQTGTWHHVALTFDATNGSRRAYLDGNQFGSDAPGGEMPTHDNGNAIGNLNGSTLTSNGIQKGDFPFNGQIDQMRLWNAALSPTDLRTRARRTYDPNSSIGTELIVEYRFDAGTGGKVYDTANTGSYLDVNMSSTGWEWTSFSGAGFGQQSMTLTNNQSGTLGPNGGSVSVSNVSPSTASDALQVYQFGRPNDGLIDDSTPGEDFSQVGVSSRINIVWGFGEIGDVSADVTFDFQVDDPSNVVLLKRSGPGQPWQDVSTGWMLDANNQTFSKNNVTDFSEYSVAGSSDTLPVELVSFAGLPIGTDAIQLRWTTASETDNAGFVIQHRLGLATQTADWRTIGHVAGTGTTDQPRTYRFVVKDLAVGSHEFRLQQTDLDGTIHFHDPVTVLLQMQEALRLSAPAPNPVQGSAVLTFSVRDDAKARLTVYNLLGQRIAVLYQDVAKAGETQMVSLNTNGWSSGMYFLRLEANGRVKTQRMVVVQ